MQWRRLQVALAGLLAALMVPMQPAHAHEVRPAYLQIDEVGPGRYQLLWRTPVLAGMRLPVVLRLPDEIHNVVEPAAQELSDSLVERRLFDAGSQGLAGRRIEFVGLQATVTDVLVRVQMLDGTHSSTLVRPSQPWVDITTSRGPFGSAATLTRRRSRWTHDPEAASIVSLWTAFALLFGAVVAVAAAISSRWMDDKISFSLAPRR